MVIRISAGAGVDAGSAVPAPPLPSHSLRPNGITGPRPQSVWSPATQAALPQATARRRMSAAAQPDLSAWPVSVRPCPYDRNCAQCETGPGIVAA